MQVVIFGIESLGSLVLLLSSKIVVGGILPNAQGVQPADPAIRQELGASRTAGGLFAHPGNLLGKPSVDPDAISHIIAGNIGIAMFLVVLLGQLVFLFPWIRQIPNKAQIRQHFSLFVRKAIPAIPLAAHPRSQRNTFLRSKGDGNIQISVFFLVVNQCLKVLLSQNVFLWFPNKPDFVQSGLL